MDPIFPIQYTEEKIRKKSDRLDNKDHHETQATTYNLLQPYRRLAIQKNAQGTGIASFFYVFDLFFVKCLNLS